MATLTEMFAALEKMNTADQKRARFELTLMLEMVNQTTEGRLFESIHDRWPEHEDTILMALKPMVLISLDRSGVRPRVGATKVGGTPDLPTGSEWPRDREARPLSFIAQFNLTACNEFKTHYPLPADGLLSLFCTTDKAELQEGLPQNALLFSTLDDPPLKPMSIPDDLDEEEGVFTRHPLEVSQGFSLTRANIPEDLKSAVERLLPRGQGGLLRQPQINRTELQKSFNPVVDELLLSLDAFGVICEPGSKTSLYGENTFHLVIDRGELSQAAFQSARLLFDKAL